MLINKKLLLFGGKGGVGKTSCAAYFDKQKIDILLKEKAQQKLSITGKEIFDKIKTLAIDSKQNELLNKTQENRRFSGPRKSEGFSRELTKKDMLLNAVFLINKKDLDQFKSDVEKIKINYKDMEFEIWGPFSPYNFVK